MIRMTDLQSSLYSAIPFRFDHEGIYKLMATWGIDTLILWIISTRAYLQTADTGVREYNCLSRSLEYAEICLGIKTCIPEGWLPALPVNTRDSLSIKEAEGLYPDCGAEEEKNIVALDITGKWSISPLGWGGYTFTDVYISLDTRNFKKLYAMTKQHIVTLY